MVSDVAVHCCCFLAMAQELALEELLAKVQARWASVEFSMLPYKDMKDVFILGGIEDIQVRCRYLYCRCTQVRNALSV
jgi:hypothetical protein